MPGKLLLHPNYRKEIPVLNFLSVLLLSTAVFSNLLVIDSSFELKCNESLKYWI